MADSNTAVAPAPAIPFPVASRVNSRQAFQVPATALGAGAVTPSGVPIQLPAVGFPKNLRLEVTITGSGGAPSFLADAPFNVFQNISLKNSAGQQLLASMNGYSWMLVNKFGGVEQGLSASSGLSNDPRSGRQYSATAPNAHFFLDVPFEFDAANGLGAIPAMASNRSYLLELTLSSIATIYGVVTPPTAVSVTVDATVVYWDAPMSTTPQNVSQGTEPFGMNLASDFTTTAIWQSEFPNIAAGAQLPRSNNQGNTIRNMIFVIRDTTGARLDSLWPAVTQFFVNNYPQLRFKKTEWQDFMVRVYQYFEASFDVAGGLEQGVYVLPFHVLAGGMSGGVQNSRAQLLPTEDGTLLQLQMNDVGATVGSLQILTQSIATPDPRVIFTRLY